MIPVSEPNLSGNEEAYAIDAVRSTWISSSGKYLNQFEEMFRSYVGTKHALAVSNGTVALHLALLALEIGPGDEVIVPNFTYIATANAVRYVGATPVLADMDPVTWNISVDSIKRLINSRTKAIIPVHLYGLACAMDEIMALADSHGIHVIEDAAEAIGSEYKGRRLGSIGKISTFSLYGNKTITTGEGGMVTTNDDKIAKFIHLLKNQGVSPTKRYWFEVIGYNYRMTNLQAAIGCAQMEQLEKFIAYKQRNAQTYSSLLSPEFGRPAELSHARNTFWMYCTLVPARINRDDFCAHLAKNGIETRPFFYLLSTMPPYATTKAEVSQDAKDIAGRGINLPSSTKLTEADIKKIATVANEFLRSRG